MKKESIMLDDVDDANQNISFVCSFLELLGEIAGCGHLDSIPSSAVSTMCHESALKIEEIKRFVEKVPYEAGPPLPLPRLRSIRKNAAA